MNDTPRKSRIEHALVRLLARDCTRSELREVVYQYADLHRLHGVPSDEAQSALRQVVQQANPVHLPLGCDDTTTSIEEMTTIILRWCARRYERSVTSIILGEALPLRESFQRG